MALYLGSHTRSWKGRRMKAIVQRGYGAPDDVLRLAEVETPAAGDREVLVRVQASSANPWDWHFIRGEPVLMRPAGIGGIRKPKFLIPGGDVAGTVEQVGGRVTGFAPGDHVYGFGHGAFAEYVAVPQGNLARKPANLTFEQAAAVPLGAITALQGLRAGGLQAGQHVLVIGASGGVGTFSVQIAKHLGAEVTGVCSTGNVDLVRHLGADHVIDYTKQSISTGPARYDLVFQLGGTYSPAAIRKVLTPHGTLIQSYGDGNRWFGPLGNMIKAAVLSRFVGQTLKAFTAKETTETLDEITELIEAGQLTPVIDRTYSLAEAAQAVQLVEQGRPAGKVTITITSDQ
jgi:NADPH:quinone reductase-like Zn-dependent oxidoreductase